MGKIFYTQKTNPKIEKILSFIEDKDYSHFEFLGDGNDAFVYGYEAYAIKIAKNSSSSFNDASVLKELDEKRTFPKVFAYKNKEFLIVEKVKGKTLGELGMVSSEQLRFFPEELKKDLLKAIDDCFEKNIVPHDLHLNNIMYCEFTKSLKIIDVGKFTFVKSEYIEQAKQSYINDCKIYQNLIFKIKKQAS